jgi:antimicrobial peptide system SdpA family protein
MNGTSPRRQLAMWSPSTWTKRVRARDPGPPSGPNADTGHGVAVGLLAVALLLLWSAVIAYTVHPILPENALQLPFEDRDVLVKLLPQGWAFFTIDPRLPQVRAYVRRATGGWQGDRGAYCAHWYQCPFLGFSRAGSLPAIEVNLIVDGVRDPLWQACRGPPPSCLETTPSRANVTDRLSRATLCGDVGIVRQEPVPWAWSGSDREVIMPSHVLRVMVGCPGLRD